MWNRTESGVPWIDTTQSGAKRLHHQQAVILSDRSIAKGVEEPAVAFLYLLCHPIMPDQLVHKLMNTGRHNGTNPKHIPQDAVSEL
jgi:hypothetical protein